jgi:UDP-glucose 6-dehydrogenase
VPAHRGAGLVEGSALRAGQVPIHEKFLPELLQRPCGSNQVFPDASEQAVQSAEAILVAVGAPPTEHGDLDSFYIESLARSFSAIGAQGFSNYSVGRSDATTEKRPTGASLAVMNHNRS